MVAAESGCVTVVRNESCAGCTGLCAWKRVRATRLSLPVDGLPLQPGDRVEISLPERIALLAAAVTYGLPLAGLLAGASLGAWSADGDVGVLIGSFLGVAAALAVAAGWRRQIEALVAGQFRVHRLSDDPC